MEFSHKELNKYLKMIAKRRYLFIFLTLLILSVSTFLSFVLPKKYKASSIVFIEKNVINDLVKGIAITPSVEYKIRVLKYAMLSRGLILKVMGDLDMDTKAKNDKELEDLILDIQKRTELSVKGNDLFIVSFQDTDPKTAMNFVNSLVRRYVEENVSSKRQEAYGANRFIVEQVDSLKDKLSKADDAIIKYRQQQGVYIAADEQSIINEIKKYKSELEALRVRRNELSGSLLSLKQQLKTVTPTVAVLSTKRAEGNVQFLENRIKQLSVSYTENYPEIIKLKAEIEAIKKQRVSKNTTENQTETEMSTVNPVYQQLEQNSYQIESEAKALEAKQRQISAIIYEKERELRNIPENRKKLAELEQERNSYKQVLEQLQMRVGQSEVSKQMEVEDKATSFRIIDPAVLPLKPFSPNRVRMILIGILGGLIGGLGGVFLRETLDSSIKDAQTLRSLGLDVLAIIPKMPNAMEEDKNIKKDKIVYASTSVYFLVIFLLFLHELMGLTYIDNVLNRLKF